MGGSGRTSAGTSTSGACAVDSGGGGAAAGANKEAAAAADNLELGELEQLTITNDNESSYDVSLTSEAGKSPMAFFFAVFKAVFTGT